MGSVSTDTTVNPSHHTDTHYIRMLHPCIIIVLFLHGLESSPVTQATQDGVNRSGEPETLGNGTYNSQEEVSTSTPATMRKERNTTVSDTNSTQTYVTAPTISCIETTSSALDTNLNVTNSKVLDTNFTQTKISLLTNNITVAYNCTPAPILNETNNSTLPTINTTKTLITTTNSTTIPNTTITTTTTTTISTTTRVVLHGVLKTPEKCCSRCQWHKMRRRCVKKGGGRCPCKKNRG